MRALPALLMGFLLLAACRSGGPADPPARGTLVVVVTTSGGAAVGGAEIGVEPGSLAQRTDDRGVARFPGLVPGEYLVTVRAAGASTIERRIDVRAPSAEVRVTVSFSVVRVAVEGLTVDWGAPESLRAVIEPADAAGEIVWTSTQDTYLDDPVVLGRGPSISTAALRPGTTLVEARLELGGGTVAVGTATVTVRYRTSWNMDLVGMVPYPDGTVGDVWMNGRHALVARRSAGGVSIVDVDRIAEVGRFAPAGMFTQDVKARGTTAFVSHEGGLETPYRQAVTLVDISDPATPRGLGGIPFELTPGAHNVWIDGTVLYVASPLSRLVHVWDVADPAAPRKLATIAGGAAGVAHDMHVRGGVLYGAYMGQGDGTPELLVASVAAPASPAVLARVTYPSAQLTHSSWLSADGRYLYLADEMINAPIRIFDVTNPATPVLVGAYQPRLGTIPHNFQVMDGRLAFLAHYKNGVEVVDVSDPVHPRLVGFYDTHPGAASDGVRGTGSLAPAHEHAGESVYEGAWGVHWTDDGRIVVSDMNRGLFVLRFRG